MKRAKVSVAFFVLFSIYLTSCFLGCNSGGGDGQSHIPSSDVGSSFDDVVTAQIFFNAPLSDELGRVPNMTMNEKGDVVQVHRSNDHFTLWVRRGKVTSNGSLEWLGGSQQYDPGGKWPSVAMVYSSDPEVYGRMIEMHTTNDLNKGYMWYHLGHFDGDGVYFWNSHKLEEGYNPDVSMSDDLYIVSIHKSQDEDVLWTKCGIYHTTAYPTATWSSSVKYTPGICPSISIIPTVTDPEKEGYVVEVHESQHDDNYLYYNVGRVDKTNGTIHWPNEPMGFPFDNKGTNPDVVVSNSGYVIETHQSQDDGTIWYHIGLIDFDNYTVTWGPSRKYDNGVTPTVAANKDFAVQLHKTQGNNDYTLWYSTGMTIGHFGWMEQMRDLIGDKPLYEITLPATHDAGMYMFQHPYIIVDSYSGFEKVTKSCVANFTQTQDQTLYSQLTGGVRYFDLRPAVHEGVHYIIHSLAGPKVEDVFYDIGKFMSECANQGFGELVIVVLSHFYNYTEPMDFESLGEYIDSYLGSYLYEVNDPQNADLLKTTFNHFTQKGEPKILLLVEKGDYDSWEKSTGSNIPYGIWPYQKMNINSQPDSVTGNMHIIDDYADSHTPDIMINDQINKLTQSGGGNEKRLFLLSWTLTAPDSADWWIDRCAYKESPHNLFQLNQEVKNKLRPNLIEYYKHYKVNFLYTDFYSFDATPDLAILMNMGRL